MFRAIRIALLSLVFTIYCTNGQLIGNLGNFGSNLGVVNCGSSTTPIPANIPESFDSRIQWPECVSPIRNQGGCGSCWAFSSSSVLTDRFCIASNATIKRVLSPQWLVSCEKKCQNSLFSTGCDAGCSGGYMDNAWAYFKSDGTVGESCIGYKAVDSQCPANCDTNSTVSSQTRFKSSSCYKFSNVQQMQADIMTYGPIQAGFSVYEDFGQYRGGVYIYDGSSKLLGGHAIKILGWGVEASVPYWIAANSWGTGWGEKGFFRIRRGTNECSIEDNALAGTAQTNGINNEKEGYVAAQAPQGTTTTSATSSPSSTTSPSTTTMTTHTVQTVDNSMEGTSDEDDMSSGAKVALSLFLLAASQIIVNA